LYDIVKYRVDQLNLDLDDRLRQSVVDVIILQEAKRVQTNYQMIYVAADSPDIISKLEPLYNYPTGSGNDNIC